MTDDDPVLNSPFDSAFRAAHQALRALIPAATLTIPDDEESLPEVVEDLQDLVRLARETAAAELGPSIRWVSPRPEEDLSAPVMLQIDLDGYSGDDPAGAYRIDHWETSSLARAGRAYKRECRWDFSPDETGMWLVSVRPYAAIGDGHQMTWTGILTGFAILHDRDEDGNYESLAHIWTARAWRRRGVGSGLLRRARERFTVRYVEGPITEEGRLLIETYVPDLCEQST